MVYMDKCRSVWVGRGAETLKRKICPVKTRFKAMSTQLLTRTYLVYANIVILYLYI